MDHPDKSEIRISKSETSSKSEFTNVQNKYYKLISRSLEFGHCDLSFRICFVLPVSHFEFDIERYAFSSRCLVLLPLVPSTLKLFQKSQVVVKK